jgi:very-short-patch-repair endonuclease
MNYKYIKYNNNLKQKARNNRSQLTKAERVFWYDVLKKINGYRFLRQKPLGEYIADFYCSKGMVIRF